MDKMEQAQDEYADTFNGKTGEDSAGAGYGIDPAKADVEAMAQAFAEPDVKVGAPIKIEKIEAEVLPEATGEASPEPADKTQPEQPEQSAAPEAKATEAAPEFKTFGQAFKYHRAQAMNGGPTTFEWNGKKFTTQLKSELPAKKAAPAKAKTATEAQKFEDEFVNRDQPKIDRSKTLAYREGAASQPVNLNEDPTRIKTADEIAAGVVRAGKVAPSEPAPKDGRPWYQAGPKNTFIREGDDPKNGPIYGSKPKGSERPAKSADELYRGKGTYQGELS